MSTKSTKEIKISNGVVVVREAITYKEHRSLVSCYLDDSLSKAQQIEKSDKISVELIVVSIDGISENIYDRFSELNMVDAQVILDHIKNVLDPKVGGK